MCKGNICVPKSLPDLPHAMRHGIASGVLLRSKKWPTDGYDPVVCHYYFMVDNDLMERYMFDAFQQWEQIANVKFTPAATMRDATCRIGFYDNLGHWSFLGTDNLLINTGEQTMNLAFDQPGAAVHEVGHHLGFGHEHKSPGRPFTLTKKGWDWYRKTQGWSDQDIKIQVVDPYQEDQVLRTEWDKHSIMQYAMKADMNTLGIEIPWNTTFSEMDREFFSTVYPSAPDQEVDTDDTFDIIELFRAMHPSPRDLNNRPAPLKEMARRLGIIPHKKQIWQLRNEIWEVLKAAS